MFVHKTGDIFTTEMPAIAHGVNIKGAMSGGIAAIIAKRFPEVRLPYQAACKVGLLDTGDFQAIKVAERPDFFIFNLASQDKPGRHARMEWLEASMEEAVTYAKNNNMEGFAIPRIGAGIGGLDWESEVKPYLEAVGAREEELTIEIWSLPDADDVPFWKHLGL